MNSEESRRLSNSQTLSQVATGLIIALAAFLAFALDKRELGLIYWALVILGVVLLVASVVLGGRGIARISSPAGLFNKQAWTCLLGFLFLGCSFFALGKPISSETNTLIANVAEKVGSTKARLDILEPSIKTNVSHVQRNNSFIVQLNDEVKQLNERLSRVEALLRRRSQPDFPNSEKTQQ